MRGYCPRCKEYRSDNGLDAWRIIWRDDRPTCERCGSYVDVWNMTNENMKKDHK
jgi:transposase-like protein